MLCRQIGGHKASTRCALRIEDSCFIEEMKRFLQTLKNVKGGLAMAVRYDHKALSAVAVRPPELFIVLAQVVSSCMLPVIPLLSLSYVRHRYADFFKCGLVACLQLHNVTRILSNFSPAVCYSVESPLQGVRDQIKKMAVNGAGKDVKEDYYAVSSSESDESDSESDGESTTSCIGWDSPSNLILLAILCQPCESNWLHISCHVYCISCYRQSCSTASVDTWYACCSYATHDLSVAGLHRSYSVKYASQIESLDSTNVLGEGYLASTSSFSMWMQAWNHCKGSWSCTWSRDDFQSIRTQLCLQRNWQAAIRWGKASRRNRFMVLTAVSFSTCICKLWHRERKKPLNINVLQYASNA